MGCPAPNLQPIRRNQLNRVDIEAWGPRDHWVFQQKLLDGYAIVKVGETKKEAVMRSIERRTGLVWCSRVRSDGSYGDEYHYVGTLGRACSGGGFTPSVQVWFSITTDPEEETEENDLWMRNPAITPKAFTLAERESAMRRLARNFDVWKEAEE